MNRGIILYKEESGLNEKKYCTHDIEKIIINSFSNSTELRQDFEELIKKYNSLFDDFNTSINEYFIAYNRFFLHLVKTRFYEDRESCKAMIPVVFSLLNIGSVFNKKEFTLKVDKRNPLYILMNLMQKGKLDRNIDTNNNNFYFTIANERYYINYENSIEDDIQLKNGNIILNNFKNINQLSRIESFRIIEKCINYKEEVGLGKDEIIKIAIFGKMENQDILEQYLEQYKRIKIEIDEFNSRVDLDRLVFESPNKEIVNLLDKDDMSTLFSLYDMILFFDMPVFYIRKIEDKDRAIGVLKNLFLSLETIDMTESKPFEDILNDFMYIYKILNSYIFLNHHVNNFKYIYDRWLVFNTKEVLKSNDSLSKKHVYFYASILDESMNTAYMRDVMFKKEIYNHRNYAVLRPNIDIGVKYDFIKKTDMIYCVKDIENHINKNVIKISMWKMLKSEERNIRKYFFNYKEKSQMIDELSRSYIIVDFDSYYNEKKIFYAYSLKYITDQQLKKYCDKSIDIIIKGLKKKNNYILNKFSNSIFSDAKFINDILIYYYLNILDFSSIEWSEELKFEDSLKLNYIQKSSIYNMIDILETTIYKYQNSDINNNMIDLYNRYSCFKKDDNFTILDYFQKWFYHIGIDSQALKNICLWKEGK